MLIHTELDSTTFSLAVSCTSAVLKAVRSLRKEGFDHGKSHVSVLITNNNFNQSLTPPEDPEPMLFPHWLKAFQPKWQRHSGCSVTGERQHCAVIGTIFSIKQYKPCGFSALNQTINAAVWRLGVKSNNKRSLADRH